MSRRYVCFKIELVEKCVKIKNCPTNIHYYDVWGQVCGRGDARGLIGLVTSHFIRAVMLEICALRFADLLLHVVSESHDYKNKGYLVIYIY